MNEIAARESAIIRDAREIISDPKRWTKGGTMDPGSPMCVMGAVCVVLGEPVFMHYHPSSPWVLNVRDRLTEHLPHGFPTVWVYNDDPQTTHQDILDLLDKTLADLGGLA